MPAPSPSRGDIIDFEHDVQRLTEGFVGREWVLHGIDDWLADDDSRLFLLTGGPGSGKSAVAGQVVRISRGETTPNGFRRLGAEGLGAFHFCQARRDETLDPLGLVRALALSLAQRHQPFAQALAQAGDQNIVIQVEQTTESAEAGSRQTGVRIDHLHIGPISARAAFNRLVRGPLRALSEAEPGTRILILVDSLDEALTWDSDDSIVTLLADATDDTADLPDGVRLLLTSRPEARVLNAFPTPPECRTLDLIADAPAGSDDVHTYVAGRLGMLAAERRTEIAGQIVAAGKGNFLYARYVVDDLLEHPEQMEAGAALAMPDGLEDVYRRFLTREIARNVARWEERYRPLLGLLAVARGDGLTRGQLHEIAGMSRSEADSVLRVCAQYLEGPRPDGPFRIYHQSFREFLLEDDTLSVYPDEASLQLAGALEGRYAGRWEGDDELGLRRYALQNLVMHLAEATAAAGQPRYHELAERLVNLALAADFQAAHEAQLASPPALRRDVETALQTAARDRHPRGPLLVTRAALGLLDLNRRQLRPETVFALAREGNLEEAEARLMLFGTDPDWRSVALLTIAWLGAGANPAAARALRDRAARDIPPDGPLAVLLRRVNAALDGGPIGDLAPLPDPPPGGVAEELVKRIGGLGGGTELLVVEGYQIPAQGELLEGRGYLAEVDAPALVANAVVNDGAGTEILRRYISVHTGYSYTHYRLESLRFVFDAILRHPKQDWLRDILPELVASALAGSVVDFQEGLPLVALALQARAGYPAADGALAEWGARLRERATPWRLEGREGDPWGIWKRRLEALAEVGSLAEAGHDRLELLQQALEVPFSYAGFQAPACLTLAEAVDICRRGDPLVGQALERAEIAAHHVQDSTHCARTTARVRVMLDNWWSPTLATADLPALIERFTRDPQAEEFAARHVIGEDYRHRTHSPNTMQLVPELLQAQSLEELAEVYRRPAPDFVRLNRARGWSAGDTLDRGDVVSVPDPGFATWLAARFAAEVLARPELGAQRVPLIQHLAPLAAPNPTTLDTVLMRLLLAAQPGTAEGLDDLAALSRPLSLDDEDSAPRPRLPA